MLFLLLLLLFVRAIVSANTFSLADLHDTCLDVRIIAVFYCDVLSINDDDDEMPLKHC